MLHFNWLAILSTSLIPLVVGFVYYNPKVMGTAWMRVTGITPESAAGANMAKVMGLTWLLGILLSTFFLPVVFHAMSVTSLVAPEAGVADPNATQDAADFLAKYGRKFLSFRHGALHGVIAALFGIWPVIGITALFERRGWKYTAIHLGYWVITFALMGGVICGFGTN
jgi:hypothetical protein